MTFNVPVSIDIAGLVLLGTRDFDLFETPLRQIRVASAEIAAKISVLQPESRSKRANLRIVPGRSITDNFDNPVVLSISHGGISVTGNFPVTLCNWSSNLMRMQIAASLSVDEPDVVAIAREAKLLVWLVLNIITVGIEEPVVVSILMMIASDLLLCRAFRISLVMRVEQATSVAHILEGRPRPIGDFKGAVLSHICASEVGLEQRAHLRVARSTILQDEEVKVEGKHVHCNWNNNESEHAETQVSREFNLPMSVQKGSHAL
jgi:hypothetical protein